MNALMVLRVALKALRVNKLRSSLTMLGMIIGVAAVIAMLAIGGGAQERVREQRKNLGSNLMLIIPGSTTARACGSAPAAAQTLTEEDAQAIALEVEGVVVAAPALRGSGQVVSGNLNWSTQFFGTNNDYLIARDWPLASGRLFEPNELSSSGKMALIGLATAQQLFGDADPVDHPLRTPERDTQSAGDTPLTSSLRKPDGAAEVGVVRSPTTAPARRGFDLTGGEHLSDFRISLDRMNAVEFEVTAGIPHPLRPVGPARTHQSACPTFVSTLAYAARPPHRTRAARGAPCWT